MATKKKTDINEPETEVKEEAAPETAAEVKEAKPKKAAKPKDEEGVLVMIPYIDGEDPEQTVIINGHVTKFRKGKAVRVSKAVARVLMQSNKNHMVTIQNQEKFKNQRTDL